MNAIVGGGSISTRGLVHVTATSHNTANATSDSANGGLGIAGGVNLPTALVGGGTTASMGATVTSATGVTVEADGTNTATATSSAFNVGGLGALADLSTDAEITSTAVVRASIGSGADIELPSRAVIVTANSHDSANTDAGAATGGLGLAISILNATAVLGGGTQATVGNNATVKASSLSLTANSNTLAPVANAHFIGIGGIAGGGGASAHATVTHSVQVSVGAFDDIELGGALTLTGTELENPLGEATGDSGSLGIPSRSSTSSRRSSGSVDAHIGDRTTVNANSVSLSATGTSTPTATGHAVGIGLASLAGSSVNATDTSSAVAYIGPKEGTFSSGTPAHVTSNSMDVEALMTSDVRSTKLDLNRHPLHRRPDARPRRRRSRPPRRTSATRRRSTRRAATRRSARHGRRCDRQLDRRQRLARRLRRRHVGQGRPRADGEGVLDGRRLRQRPQHHLRRAGQRRLRRQRHLADVQQPDRDAGVRSCLTLANVGLIGGATGGVLSETNSPVLLTKVAGRDAHPRHRRGHAPEPVVLARRGRRRVARGRPRSSAPGSSRRPRSRAARSRRASTASSTRPARSRSRATSSRTTR